MKFTSSSNEFIKKLIPFLKKNQQTQNTQSSSSSTILNNSPLQVSQFNKILEILYKDIYDSYKITRSKSCFKINIIKITDVFKHKKPDMYDDSRYLSSFIKKFINENEKYQLNYYCNIGGRKINIYFTLFSEDELLLIDTYTEYINNIYIWLTICDSYSSKRCANKLDLYIYPTPFSKKLPEKMTSTISTEHVNSAFTLSCAPVGEIVIYRKEEWFKVFIHETFHAYGLDFGNHTSKKIHETLAQIFPINSEYDATEAYTETWARIMNCAMVGFNLLENKENKKEFIKNIDFCLQIERFFSLYQATKVLRFMGLRYQDIHKLDNNSSYLRNNLYRENTHVFAYYILTSILMNNYIGFLVWCYTHNTSLLQFSASDYNFKEFSKYIKRQYDKPMQEEIIKLQSFDGYLNTNNNNNNNNELLNTTRMSIIENN